ncbi:hypothetical protein GCM10023185_41220 [Hymenobacter saemangeumensis]|uniref:Uncharacterized protein n=1 Tax=Hymenobacter saemangeumensis TaxID=1084522 RepID=A0ABP8IRR7_9BACT
MELASKSLGVGLILLLLLTLPVELLFNGLGLSRVSNYFDHYQGSMSWAHYRVAFRPQGTGQQPAPDLWFPNWRYGFNS